MIMTKRKAPLTGRRTCVLGLMLWWVSTTNFAKTRLCELRTVPGCRSCSTSIIVWYDLAIVTTPTLGVVHLVFILDDEQLQIFPLTGFLHHLPQSRTERSVITGSLAAFFHTAFPLHTTAYRTSTDLLKRACLSVEQTADVLAPLLYLRTRR